MKMIDEYIVENMDFLFNDENLNKKFLTLNKNANL